MKKLFQLFGVKGLIVFISIFMLNACGARDSGEEAVSQNQNGNENPPATPTTQTYTIKVLKSEHLNLIGLTFINISTNSHFGDLINKDLTEDFTKNYEVKSNVHFKITARGYQKDKNKPVNLTLQLIRDGKIIKSTSPKTTLDSYGNIEDTIEYKP